MKYWLLATVLIIINLTVALLITKEVKPQQAYFFGLCMASITTLFLIEARDAGWHK